MPLETRLPEIARFGAFEVDLRAGELRKQGKRVKLQDQPFQVLAALLRRPGDLVTREELRSRIWPEDTFVDFDNSLNTAINKLREALGDSADSPRFVETLPRRGYRFLVPVTGDGLEKPAPKTFSRRTVPLLGIAVVLSVAAVAGGWFWRSRHSPVLTEKDTIVLSDFKNAADDPVFDDTLKQGLRAQLEQSPFLNLLSEQQVNEELRLMARQAGERLTADVAGDLCRRIGSKAVLTGSISSLGSHYVISLDATNCQTGAILAAEQSESPDKEHVLAALGASATKIRQKLGESLPSIQKYDVPIERVTTGSLDALRAYSLGMKYVASDDMRAALPYFQRAVGLDPNFASAYSRVAYAAFYVPGQGSLINENRKKAYALRDRVSRREYFHITTRYFKSLGEAEKAESEAVLWAEDYPRDAEARFILADMAMWKGNWGEAVKQGRLSVEANPNDVRNYYNLAVSELALDRFDAATRTCSQAIARNTNDPYLHMVRYWIAFARHDSKEMENELRTLGELARDNPEAEFTLLEIEGAAEMYYGKLTRARVFTQRMLAFDPRILDLFGGYADNVGRTTFSSYWALLNAELGNQSEARAYVRQAAQAHQSHDADFTVALAAARAGEISLAEKWAAEYDRSFPSGWSQQERYLPVVRAAVAMGRGNAAKAIEHLRAVNGDTAWRANDPSTGDGLMPAYLRGMAYLQLRQGSEAAAEFQRLIDHPGIVVNSPFGPLARVGLARAYALRGDTAKARAAYREFLTLWKDADPDIPILQQAKAEIAKLP